MEHPKEFAEGLSIGIIMDGNGRWAKQRGLPRTAGHKKGAAVFQDIANYCEELGVSSVYFYAFSTENWKRPLEEVSAIMKLFGEYLLKGFNYKDRNIRIKFLGDRTALDPKLQKLMNELEGDSASKTGMTLNIAVNYGGRPEIVRAAQQLAARVAAGELKPEEITEEMIENPVSKSDADYVKNVYETGLKEGEKLAQTGDLVPLAIIASIALGAAAAGAIAFIMNRRAKR